MATIFFPRRGPRSAARSGARFWGCRSAVGRFAGAALGRSIDQRLMGAGLGAVETGRVERFRLTGAGRGRRDGAGLWADAVAGQVIWATRVFRDGDDHGAAARARPPSPKRREFSAIR